MDMLIMLVFTAIICIAFGTIFRSNIKHAVAAIIISGVIAVALLFYFGALSIPVIIMSVSIVFVSALKISDDSAFAAIFAFVAFVVTVIILVIIYGLNPAPFITDREISQSYDLVAVKQTVRTSGEMYFLSGSLEEGDYYEYRYKDGNGTRSGKISKYTPLIVEDEALRDTGKMYRYVSFKDHEENQGIWKVLFGPGGRRDYLPGEQVEIYVPKGTVDRTMGAM